MNQNIDRVKEFQLTTASPVLLSPAIPDGKRIDLRVSLLEEEVSELETAANKDDLTGVLDALCDIQYVLNGAILEFGLQGVFQEAFEEVHNSNMSKFPALTEDARQTVMQYGDKNVEAYYKKVAKNFVIYRSKDNKILKGLNYFEPRLSAILKAHVAKK